MRVSSLPKAVTLEADRSRSNRARPFGSRANALPLRHTRATSSPPTETVEVETTSNARTDEIPLATSLIVVAQFVGRADAGVNLAALVPLRLVDERAALFVERKPRDVHRAVRDRQRELAVPDARAARQDLDVVHLAAVLPLLRTARAITHIVQHCQEFHDICPEP